MHRVPSRARNARRRFRAVGGMGGPIDSAHCTIESLNTPSVASESIAYTRGDRASTNVCGVDSTPRYDDSDHDGRQVMAGRRPLSTPSRRYRLIIGLYGTSSSRASALEYSSIATATRIASECFSCFAEEFFVPCE